MLSIIFWVAFGVTIGWAAAIIRNAQDSWRLGGYMVVGATGGFVGGFLGGLLDPITAGYRPATTDMVFAVFGATTFVFFAGLIARKLSNQQN